MLSSMERLLVASNAARGARGKVKTRKYLAALGYQVFEMEVVRWVQTPRGRLPVKRDQLHADLGALSATELLFVQVKAGQKNDVAGAVRGFKEHTFPPFAKLWVVFWKFRARGPIVTDVTSQVVQ